LGSSPTSTAEFKTSPELEHFADALGIYLQTPMKVILALLFLVVATYTVDSAATCGSPGHAHCSLTWIIQGQCTDVFNKIKANIETCCAQKTIKTQYTNYTLLSADLPTLSLKSHIHFTDKYIDDQEIDLVQDGLVCNASVCSHAESPSNYDYCANYCDGHNLIRGLGLVFTETIGVCKYIPNASAKCSSSGLVLNSAVDVGDDPKDTYCDSQ